jgi:hypothetical protein
MERGVAVRRRVRKAWSIFGVEVCGTLYSDSIIRRAVEQSSWSSSFCMMSSEIFT